MANNNLLERVEKIEHVLNRFMEDKYLLYIKNILASYLRLINIYIEHGKISPTIIFPEINDSISRELIEILFSVGELNTSQLTDALKCSRGSASRRIVREKLETLVEKGIVEYKEKKEKLYILFPNMHLKNG